MASKDENRGASNVMVAWYTAPTAGGLRVVLFMDGSVGAITESEFQKRPKVAEAGKK